MPLLLSLIINRENQIILSPDFQEGLVNLIQNYVHPRLLNTESRGVIKDPRYYIYYWNQDYTFYFVISNPDYPSRIAWLFLKELKEEYQKFYSDPMVIKSLMQDKLDYMNNPQNDKILELKSRIEEVQNIMITDIEKVIQRGENLQEIELNTRNLTAESERFEKQAEKQKWKSVLLFLIATFIFLIISGLLAFIIIILPYCIIAKKC